MEQATPWERERIERLGVARIPVEAVSEDAAGAARRALALVRSRFNRFVVHLDVDVIDFTDAPLSENTGRNIGCRSKRRPVLCASSCLTTASLRSRSPSWTRPMRWRSMGYWSDSRQRSPSRCSRLLPDRYSTGPSTSS
jgi:hypothetical protein